MMASSQLLAISFAVGLSGAALALGADAWLDGRKSEPQCKIVERIDALGIPMLNAQAAVTGALGFPAMIAERCADGIIHWKVEKGDKK